RRQPHGSSHVLPPRPRLARGALHDRTTARARRIRPGRIVRAKPIEQPEASAFAEFARGSGSAAASTTMAFTRLLRNLLRDKNVGKRVVPIIPDEARTFGMDPLFKEVGIYSPLGQRS